MKKRSPSTIQSFVKVGMASLVFLLLTTGLMGHATLLNTVPPANARLEQSPPRVELHFNEGIEAIFNGVMVLNHNGLPVHQDEAELSRNRKVLSVGVREDLPQGIYTVTWKGTSSDGHQIGGNFGFSVGEEFQTSGMVAGDSGGPSNWPSAGLAINRWLYLLAMMMFVGGFTFGAVILLPVVKNPSLELSSEVSAEMRRVFLRFFSWSWVVLVLTAVLNLLFKAAAMADLAGDEDDLLAGIMGSPVKEKAGRTRSGSGSTSPSADAAAALFDAPVESKASPGG